MSPVRQSSFVDFYWFLLIFIGFYSIWSSKFETNIQMIRNHLKDRLINDLNDHIYVSDDDLHAIFFSFTLFKRKYSVATTGKYGLMNDFFNLLYKSFKQKAQNNLPHTGCTYYIDKIHSILHLFDTFSYFCYELGSARHATLAEVNNRLWKLMCQNDCELMK